MNIDSFYLNSAPLSPTGYLPLKLDAITKSETAPDRANRPDWREYSRSLGGGGGAISRYERRREVRAVGQRREMQREANGIYKTIFLPS